MALPFSCGIRIVELLRAAMPATAARRSAPARTRLRQGAPRPRDDESCGSAPAGSVRSFGERRSTALAKTVLRPMRRLTGRRARQRDARAADGALPYGDWLVRRESLTSRSRRLSCTPRSSAGPSIMVLRWPNGKVLGLRVCAADAGELPDGRLVGHRHREGGGRDATKRQGSAGAASTSR